MDSQKREATAAGDCTAVFSEFERGLFSPPPSRMYGRQRPPMPPHAHADTATNTKIPNWYPHMRTIATKDAEVPLGGGLQKLSSLQLNLQLLHVPHNATYLFISRIRYLAQSSITTYHHILLCIFAIICTYLILVRGNLSSRLPRFSERLFVASGGVDGFGVSRCQVSWWPRRSYPVFG